MNKTTGMRYAPALLIAVLASLAIVSASAVGSQAGLPQFERQVYGIEVQDAAGVPYAHPFLGGFNLPRPQLVDIDVDGDLDLFVQEYSGEIMFFEQVGTAADPEYVWRTDSYEDLDVGEWYHFADVDDDGDYDLLAEERFSLIRFFRNQGDAKQPSFDLVTEKLLDTAGEAVFSDRQNIPKVGDIDCDNRLDLMLGRLEGTITRYEADGVDELGAPRFRHVTDRFQDIEIIGQQFGNTADEGATFAFAGSPGDAAGRRPTMMHGANTMALEDIDGDGDLDLFWGDFFEAGLLFIENTGSCTTPSLRSEPESFPLNDPIATSGYNAPAFGDIDGDGDNDLLIGVLGGAFNPNSTTIDNFYHLKQTTRNSFDIETARYVTNIDVGSETFPAFADLDGDGDLDLVLGNKIEPDDNDTGKLFHFENIGSAAAPAFRLRGVMPEFTGRYHFAPAFADLDGDGDLDILMGSWNDTMMLVINEGSVSSPEWSIVDEEFLTLTRGRNATPTLGDIDGDGDLDLVLGSEGNGLMLYRNNGSPQAPDFVLDESFSVSTHPFSTPTFADIDGDGDKDLFAGGIGGGLLFFENR